VEEMILSGRLPSQVYRMLGHDFYSSFEFSISTANCHFLRQTHGFSVSRILKKNAEMNREFIPK
jgi:hypothetical protein